MSVEARVGVVLVTHNSVKFLAETWQSILSQDYPIARIAVIDDHSTDHTRGLLEELVARSSPHPDIDITIESSTSADSNIITRIAQNFTQGVRMLTDCDVITLGDHDDIWCQDRIRSQVSLLEHQPTILMLASNGRLSSTGTLFENFEVPVKFNELPPANQLRHVLLHSVATGGASMLRVSDWLAQDTFVPPPGWLHDRWWSIVAASKSGIAIGSEPVIEYRVSEGQRVGLDRGRQTSDTFSRLRRSSVADVARLRALHRLRRTAAPALRESLTYSSLLRTYVS